MATWWKDKRLWFAVFLTLLAFGLRIYKIHIPDRLIGDEVYYVPAARSILGQNEAGVPRDAGYAHPPLAKMIIAVGIALFGDNPFGWRIMSVIAGTIIIPAFYVLVKKLTQDSKELENAPTLAAFLMSFETLTFYFSHVARIDIFMMLFFIVGAVFLMEKKTWRKLLAAPLFALSFLSKEAALLMILPLLLWAGIRTEAKNTRKTAKKAPLKHRFDWKTVGVLLAATGICIAGMWYVLEWVVLTPRVPSLVERISLMLRRLDIDNPAARGRSEIWMWFFNQPVTRAAAVQPGVRIDPATINVGPILNPVLQYAYIVQPSWTIILPMIPTMVYMLYLSRSSSVARFVAMSWFGVLIGWIIVNVAFRGLMYLFYVLTLVPAVIIGISIYLSRGLYYESKNKSVKISLISFVYLLLHVVNFVALYPVPVS